jgi:hypothetical protein
MISLKNKQTRIKFLSIQTNRKRSGEKGKKAKNYNSSDVEGCQGSWTLFVDEIIISRSSEV